MGGQYLEASARYVGEGVDKMLAGPQGVDITVWTSNGDFSAMGYVVDQIDSLIDEWFPGERSLCHSKGCLFRLSYLWSSSSSVVRPFD